MAASSGPDVIDAGLVLALDAADRNSFDSNENLLTYSEQFDDAAWISSYGQNAPATANQIAAPDGTTTADLITFTPDGTGQSRKEQNTGTQSGTYTASIFVKNGTIGQISLFVTTSQFPYPNISYNFTTDTITNNGATGTRTLYPNGWVRITATATVTSHTMYSGLLSGATGTIYAWGAQLERGSSPSPYYPTTGTAKNRGSTLIDLIGNGNNGTLTNGPTYSSSNNGSIVFDGTNDYIDTSYTPPNTNWSISMFFNATSYPSYNRGLFSTYSTTNYNGLYCGTNTSNGLWVFTDGNGVTNLTYTFIPNTWYQITFTITTNQLFCYVNGTLINQINATTTHKDVLNIGRTRFDLNYWNGRIAQTQIYNRALTEAEIQQNFNATRSRFGI